MVSTSDFSERQDEVEEVTQSQKIYAELFKQEIPHHLSEWITIFIKPERTSFTPRSIAGSGHNDSLKAKYIFSAREMVQVQVKNHFSVWMLKVLLFERMCGSEGFDPPSIYLYLLPNQTENPLQNEDTVGSLKLVPGNILLAVPVVQAKATKKPSIAKKLKAPRCHPNFTFAIGRGLSRGVVGFPCEFTIFPVNKAARYIHNDDKFSITFHLMRNNKEQNNVAAPVMETRQDKQGRTVIRFVPQTAGDYMIHILYKKQPIVTSPAQLIVVNFENSHCGIRELAFTGWDVEAASVLGNLSLDGTQHDLIFGVGMPALLYLFSSSSDSIQKDMSTVLSHLLDTEENQIRIATEGSIQFVNKILMNPYWLHSDPVCRFIGRIISFALETNSTFRRNFLKQTGVEPLLSLAYSPSIESVRYAVKSFFVISVHTDNITYLLKHGLFMEAIIHLLNVDDVMVKRYCLHTFFNLTRSELFNDSLTQRKLNLFVQQLKTSDRRLQLDVLIILSQVHSPFSTKAFIEANVYETVYNCLNSESTIQWWEIQYTHVDINIEEFITEHLSNSETRLQSDLNTVTLRYLNSVFSMASRLESEGIAEHICQYQHGEVLKNICLFAGSVEIRVQREACKLMCYLSQHIKCRDAIIKEEGVEWLLGSFKFIDILRQKYLFDTLAQLSHSFNSSYELIDDTLLDYFLQLTESQDKILQDRSVTIIAHLAKNKVYRDRLISNNIPLLCKILETARNVGLSIHSRDISWEQIEIEEGSELSGQAALTKVYKCNVNGVTYALKKFNVNDIQFSQKEFQSEVALMSFLSHKNIVSAIAASIQRPHLFILSNLYSRGSLSDVIKYPNLQFSIVIKILLDAARGMEYLHSVGVIHRDIKPGNIFIDENFHAAIADFGTSRVCKDRMTPTVGTTIYMAPDLVESTSYTKKSDVYSFGITLWEVMERRVAFPSAQPIDIIFGAKAGVRPNFSVDSPLQELTKACWDTEPNSRPSFTDIITKLLKLQENEDFIIAPPSKNSQPTVRLPPKLSKDISRESIHHDTIEPQERNLVDVIEPKQPKRPGKIRSLRSQTSKRFDKMKLGIIGKNKPSPSSSDYLSPDTIPGSVHTNAEEKLQPIIEKPKRKRRRRKTVTSVDDTPAGVGSGIKVKPQKSPRKSSPRKHRSKRRHKVEGEKSPRRRRRRRAHTAKANDSNVPISITEKKNEQEEGTEVILKPRSNTIHTMAGPPAGCNPRDLQIETQPQIKPLIIVKQSSTLTNSRSFDIMPDFENVNGTRLRSSSVNTEPKELAETVAHARETVASIAARFGKN